MKKTRFSIHNLCAFNVSNFYEGESIEAKVTRIVLNKEPIKDGAPLIYTDRKDGVLPGYDIRTDRFEVAVEAMDKITKSKIAKRYQYMDKEPLANTSDGKQSDLAKNDAKNDGKGDVNSGDPSQ